MHPLSVASQPSCPELAALRVSVPFTDSAMRVLASFLLAG
jgi:hypothetical protein